MKLIKLLYNFDTPLKEDVKAFFPRDLEETLKSEYILVSDAKFRLLQFAKVGMHVYKEFTETAAHNMDALFGLREDYIIVKEIIEPSKFDIDTFDLKDYDLGDFIFFYAEGPVKPEPPVKPNFHSGLFNYELSEAQKKILMDKYEEDYKEYESAYKEYETELETFMEEEASLPIFDCLGLVIKPETKVPGTVLKIFGDKKLLILLDASFETTKDVEQFGEFGKIPKDRPTLVGTAIGGLKAGESLKGLSYVDILTKAFGLEEEEDVVGTVQPDGDAEGMSAPKTDYGEGKTSLGGPTETATITTKLDADSEATNVKLVNAKTGETVTTKAVADPTTPVSFEVTGLTETTSYNIEAYHTEDEEEVVDGSSKVTVRVKAVPATVKLTATPTTVATLDDEVVFTAIVTAGSSAITSVKLFEDVEGATGVNMTVDPEDETKYTKTISNISKNTTYFVVVTDANGQVESSKVTITSTYILPKLSNMTATPATITAATDITITATATKGTSDIARVLFWYIANGVQINKIITSNFDNISEVIQDVNETITFNMGIEDSEGVIGNTVTATVTLNS